MSDTMMRRARLLAEQTSLEAPAITFFVLQKPGFVPIVLAKSAKAQTYIDDGWEIKATYKAGKEISHG